MAASDYAASIHHEDGIARMPYGRRNGQALADISTSELMYHYTRPDIRDPLKTKLRIELRSRFPSHTIEVPRHLRHLARTITEHGYQPLRRAAIASGNKTLHHRLSDAHVAILAAVQDLDDDFNHVDDDATPHPVEAYELDQLVRQLGRNSAAPARRAPAMEAARSFLRLVQPPGATWQYLVKAGRARGLSEATLRRARRGLLTKTRLNAHVVWVPAHDPNV